MFHCLTVLVVQFLIIANTLAKKNSTELNCYSGSFSNELSCKGDNLVTHCYYTSTLATTLKFNQKNRSPVYNISCDFTGICDKYNATGPRENTFIEIPGDANSTTHLFCCNTDKCNKPKELVNKRCYNAYKTENITQGTIEQCTTHESHCTKLTAHVNSTEMQYFSCEQNIDLTDPCKEVKDAEVKCFNRLLQGVQVKLCCCYGDLCLVPTFNFTEGHTVVELNETIWLEHLIKPLPKTKKESTDWLFVGGLISAGVLVLLIVIAAIIIAMKCRKKKETDRMMLAYTRLAADSTPDDDADVRMLLG